jgi:hypothetical protein
VAGGPGADNKSTLAQEGIDPAYYPIANVDTVLDEMAARGMIPAVSVLSPLDSPGGGRHQPCRIPPGLTA